MTGVQRPWLWSLPTRVELAEGAVIQFRQPGQPGVTFKQRQVDKMFEVGLMQPAGASDQDPDSAVDVTLYGDARFLVGEVDLGPEVGMEVLVRGLEVAVDAANREYRERHPRVEPDEDDGEDSGPDETVFDEPDLLGLSHEITVPVDEAGDRLEDLLDEIDHGAHGAHVVLVQDGKRVAVMMSWPAYADLREKLARMAVAFWTGWRSGVFDVAGYATDVTRTLHRRGTKPDPSSDDEGSTSEDGGGDERAR